MSNEKSLRVLIRHPHVGSKWLFNARVKENIVEGLVAERHPCTFSNKLEWYPMNFPKSCMQKAEISDNVIDEW